MPYVEMMPEMIEALRVRGLDATALEARMFTFDKRKGWGVDISWNCPINNVAYHNRVERIERQDVKLDQAGVEIMAETVKQVIERQNKRALLETQQKNDQ